MSAADYLKRARAASAFVDPPEALLPLIDALEAVLKRHTPHTETDCVDHWPECFIGGDSKCHNVGRCRICRATFPCLTVQAITTALIGGDAS